MWCHWHNSPVDVWWQLLPGHYVAGRSMEHPMGAPGTWQPSLANTGPIVERSPARTMRTPWHSCLSTSLTRPARTSSAQESSTLCAYLVTIRNHYDVYYAIGWNVLGYDLSYNTRDKDDRVSVPEWKFHNTDIYTWRVDVVDAPCTRLLINASCSTDLGHQPIEISWSNLHWKIYEGGIHRRSSIFH